MLTKKQQELLLFIHQKLQKEGIPPSFDEMKDALGLKSKSGIHRLITALEERGFIRRLANRARALAVIRLPDGHEVRMREQMQNQIIGFSEPGAPKNTHTGPAASAKSPDAEDVDPQNNANQTSGGDNPVEFVSALARRGFTPSVIDGGFDSSTRTLKSASNVLSAEFGGNNDGKRDAAGFRIPVMGRIAAGVPISAIENHSHSTFVPPHMIGQGEYFALEVEGESMIEAGIHDGDTVICHKTSTATVGDIVVAFIDDEEATLKRFRRQGKTIALEAANPAFETRVFNQDRVKVQGRLVGLMRSY